MKRGIAPTSNRWRALLTALIGLALLAPPAFAAGSHEPSRSASASVPQKSSHGPDLAPRLAARARAAASVNTPPAPSETLPSRWCGDELRVDGTANGWDNGHYRFHAVYVLPADGPFALGRIGDEIQREAIGASALIERQYGRAIRFDWGTRCGPQYLDITTVRMAQTTRELRAITEAPGALFAAVRAAIASAGFDLDDGGVMGIETNYVAWVDAPAPRGICGQAELYPDPSRSQDNLNNTGGKVAAVYAAGTGLCGEDVVRHEIAHTLGALQREAPHAFDGSHCDDALEDTMCESNAPRRGDGGHRGEFFDFGNDDYWSLPGTPLAWWSVDLSRFICPDASCNVAGGVTPAALAGPAAENRTPAPAAGRKAKPKPRSKSHRTPGRGKKAKGGARRAGHRAGSRGRRAGSLKRQVRRPPDYTPAPR